ncbi:chemotaxis protein CheB [Rhodoferax sp.]|uniref:chemotaxis protein CheB n=1 Tax=Rhodoferax sp. TaxID=50421 RepID=UPI00374D340C
MRSPAPSLQHIQAVVIGASAGGVEALLKLLPALPRGLAAAVFVVLHLPRESRSLLVEIFGPVCQLPVREALDKDRIAPGTIYFAPPDYHLLLDTGPQLALSVDEPVNFSRPSIDVLFETAADLYQERLMGVILTGSNDDGTAGLAAVRRGGGITVVQNPGTAVMSEMPAAALRGGPADYVLDLDEMADLLKTLNCGVQA